MADEDDEPEPTPDTRYVAHFRDHLNQVQREFVGGDGDELDPSYIAPCGYWSRAEKNAFFHGLCIHSRLRPDLIAESVKTKTIADVCAYIDLLEASMPSQIEHVRNGLEIALEMSSEWIEHEEDMANLLATAEFTWEGEDINRQREEKMQVEIRGTKRKGEKPRRGEIKKLRLENNAQQVMQDALRGLDLPRLKCMDRLLREDEEERATVVDSSNNPTTTPEPPASPAPDCIPDQLSPVSRRRLHKRLYMRRKRAEMNGGTVSTDVVRLKPGRKSKDKKRQEGDAQDEDICHPHIGGVTLPYKIMSQMTEANFTVEKIREGDLGLFHLTALGKLMKMYTMLHDVPSNINSQISAETIRFLHWHVVEFVTELMHRAIVSAEQEKRLKLHTKVWRISEDQIVAGNIHHALEMMGVHTVDKKIHFSGLLERLGLKRRKSETDSSERSTLEEESGNETDDTRGSGSDEDDASVNGTDVQDSDGECILPVVPLHQQIYAPSACIPPNHAFHLLSADQSSTLMDTDEALATELQEEEQLDLKDMSAARYQEDCLWEDFA